MWIVVSVKYMYCWTYANYLSETGLFKCLNCFFFYLCKRTGFAIEKESNEKDILLTCGTEKGKHKCKNHRTAGTCYNQTWSWECIVGYWTFK